MGAYILKRLLLMIPTLLGVMLVTFAIMQFVPGGPIESIIASLEKPGAEIERSGGGGGEIVDAGQGGDQPTSRYRGAQGLDPEFIKKLEKQFGFDKPVHERFGLMMWNYLRFDFGESYFKGKQVTTMIWEALPVSISLGLWLTLISYLVSVPLGIRKAVKDGSSFDIWTSSVVIIGYAIPNFIFAIILIVLFAGGSYYDWFPLGRLKSDNFDELSLWGKMVDYVWHLALPLIAMGVSSFATMTLLTKNSFLDEIKKQYVVTARAKGLTEDKVLYGHIFRNAMLLVIAGFPGAFLGAFFSGALLIEIVFSLDGLGLLTFNSVVQRDYAVVLANLYIMTIFGLLVALINDLMYTFIDPRIDFESRDT
jgi:microcin C transport system permease protein